MHCRSILRTLISTVAIVVAAASCASDSPLSPPDGSVTVTMNLNDVFEWYDFTVRASVRDVNGHTLNNATVTWSSSDTTIVVVDSAGHASALRPGKTQITAQTDGMTGSLAITVRPQAVRQVSVRGLPDTLESGDILVFSVRVQGDGGRDLLGHQVVLASSDTNIALIDASGRVRAVSAGAATVTAAVDGVVGAAPIVVASQSAELQLLRLGGAPVPTLISEDSAASNGAGESREVFLEGGTLQLSGGAEPRYQTVLHYAEYSVSVDIEGQRHVVLASTFDVHDAGSVRYDARGNLTMASDSTANLTQSASPEAGGFLVQYRKTSSDSASTLLFSRAAY
jgi:hypothetical protein